MADRPTTDFRIAVLDVFDDVWSSMIARLDGLTDDEYLWEPAPGAWSVRSVGDGSARIDGFREPDLDVAPVTTIAWRLQHIAVDCLDSYSDRAFGRTGARAHDDEWYLEPAPAIDDAERAWTCFREGAAARSVDDWWQVLGPDWGPFAQHSLLDLALHALHEVTHHAAEIALLRDLYGRVVC
jgi:hypothetical protein